VSQRTCKTCEIELTGAKRSHCSKACAILYNTKVRRESGRLKGPKPLKFPFTCVICSRDGMATRVEATRHAYCSRVSTRTPTRKLSPSTVLVHVPKVHPARVTPTAKGSLWFMGACSECGIAVTSSNGARTCSQDCADMRSEGKRTHKGGRRKVLEAGMKLSKTLRLRVANRNGWVCQICFLPVPRGQQWFNKIGQPLYPSLDHIIPLANGGEHSEINLTLTHFRCNSTKGTREAWVPDAIFTSQMRAFLATA
jgi:hypothetical protein